MSAMLTLMDMQVRLFAFGNWQTAFETVCL
jgi:hypothetical protein